ncbi:MAG: FHA domain-containing protein [Myxococcota bacterium]
MRTLIGRSQASTLHLDSDCVSAEHAVLFYDGGRWHVRDLGSTNGTWLDGTRVEPGRKTALKAGSVVYFGEVDALHGWRLVSDLPAGARAKCIESGEVKHAMQELLQLPNPDEALLTVYFDHERNVWIAETDAGTRPIDDQCAVQVGADSYLLELPPGTRATSDTRRRERSTPSLLDATFSFSVSRDEEHVELELQTNVQSFRLPSRSFHYLLVTLARRRIADCELPLNERGWMHVEDLMKQMRVSRQKLNLDVSRARRQLAELGVAHAAMLIERRPQASQLRLGVAKLEAR